MSWPKYSSKTELSTADMINLRKKLEKVGLVFGRVDKVTSREIAEKVGIFESPIDYLRLMK